MEFLLREEIMTELQQSFHTLMDKYNLDDIGIFEEEGPNNQYYMGYTIKKNGETYMVHLPYTKNHEGRLAPMKQEWTVESDEPNKDDLEGYKSLDEVFQDLT